MQSTYERKIQNGHKKKKSLQKENMELHDREALSLYKKMWNKETDSKKFTNSGFIL